MTGFNWHALQKKKYEQFLFFMLCHFNFCLTKMLADVAVTLVSP